MSDFELYVDKNDKFECSMKLEGADLDNAKARLIIKTKTLNLMLEGSISGDGKCVIPLQNLKSLIREGSSGSLELEVIVEDLYFKPWKSDFVAKVSKKLTVEVVESKQVTKPKVDVIVETVKSTAAATIHQASQVREKKQQPIIQKKQIVEKKQTKKISGVDVKKLIEDILRDKK